MPRSPTARRCRPPDFALNTQAPAGGRIENGLFVDAAMSLVESKIPAPTPAEQDAALAKVQEQMLSAA